MSEQSERAYLIEKSEHAQKNCYRFLVVPCSRLTKNGERKLRGTFDKYIDIGGMTEGCVPFVPEREGSDPSPEAGTRAVAQVAQSSPWFRGCGHLGADTEPRDGSCPKSGSSGPPGLGAAVWPPDCGPSAFHWHHLPTRPQSPPADASRRAPPPVGSPVGLYAHQALFPPAQVPPPALPWHRHFQCLGGAGSAETWEPDGDVSPVLLRCGRCTRARWWLGASAWRSAQHCGFGGAQLLLHAQ